VSDVTVPSTFHLDNSQKKICDKKMMNSKKKSHTNIDKTIKTNTKSYKYVIRKTRTYNFSHKNALKQEPVTKEEEENNKDLKKSRTILLDKNNSLKKLKAVLETIHEVSNSIIDSSELSISNDDNKNKKNDNNG
jgi:hypothetical protein